jgi:hypothetical protein
MSFESSWEEFLRQSTRALSRKDPGQGGIFRAVTNVELARRDAWAGSVGTR